MHLKNPLCQVLCLVITVILYPAATAENDTFSLDTFVCYKMEKLEQAIMRKLETHLEQHSTQVKVEKTCDAQHEEVIEKLAALTTKVQQMAESIESLRNQTCQLNAGKELTNVKNESIERSNQSNKDVMPASCTTLNINETGTYSIRPAGVLDPFLVRCDFEDNFELGGGWTVFQHRFNGTVDFYQNWPMYKNGFGDVNGEHWLGLEKLHAMTRSGRHELLVLLEDHEGNTAHALYDSFQVGSEAEKYKLTVGGYSGTAGDSLNYQNGMKFSTFDQDNDKDDDHNCAQYNNGAWWFNACFNSHLNGKFFQTGEHLQLGVAWYHWKRLEYSLKSSKMMLRRRSE
uniref:Fibrinogen C-terminal domain-containing protein n=1 Tax=Anopheles atroparvus TaxID=41427 RepID=A0AAG5DK23_ANOAO